MIKAAALESKSENRMSFNQSTDFETPAASKAASKAFGEQQVLKDKVNQNNFYS